MTRYALSVCLLALLAWSAPALAFDIDRYVTMDGEDTGNCATLGQACRTPRYALSVSNAGDVIYIHHGEYAQHLIIDRNITLRGGGPGMTTLLGPGGVTALERVITVDGAYQVRIEGLSIKDGAAHAANGLFDGGGIYSTASHLTLNNVRVEDNRSTRHGGGIYHGVGQLFLINTVITGNHLALYGSPVLTWGGGLYLASGQAVIVNSTLVGNMADQGGGLVVRPDANAWLMNSIVWQNISWDDIGHEIHQEGQTGLMIQHSIFRDRPAESDVVGSGIIVDAASLNEDPDWLSSDYPHDRDYRLRPMSPAINAGLNTFYAQAGGDPATDLDHGGDWRVWNHANGGAIDIGAYEFQGEPADLAPPVLQLPAYNAINVARPTGLVWRSVPLADSYQVQVTVASDNIAMAFSDPVIDVTLSDTRFRAEDLDALRDYDWRVRAVMNGFVGEWSPPWRFTTQGTLQTGAGNILHITSSSRGDATGRNWYNAHGSLANALKWAAFNEGRGLWDSDNPLQIWVASGFHRPAHRPEDLLEMPILSSQASFVLVPDVHLYGGFNALNSNADMDSRDPEAYPAVIGHYGGFFSVVIAAGPVGNARLDGFTLSGGHARGDLISQVRGETVYRSVGGALNLVNSSPTLSRLRIAGNQARDFGGGIFANGSQALLDRVRIEDNISHQFDGGGLYSTNSQLVIVNSLFAGNHAFLLGGGIAQSGGRLHLVNSTITNNASSFGAGIYNTAGVLDMDNSILWGNQAHLGHQYGGDFSSGLWRYSLVGNEAGDLTDVAGLVIEHALHANPQFIDPDDGNYLPGPASPARDSGSNALYVALNGPDTDLAGNPRIVNGTIDRGALEDPSGPDDRIFQDGFEQQDG